MKYKTIVADPPWRYGLWGKNSGRDAKSKTFYVNIPRPLPYSTMTVKEICNLPVQDFSDSNCDLYLWTTQKYLHDAFHVMDAWGFKYCQTLSWCKKPRGTGQGGLFCPTNEFLLLGRIGRMPVGKRRIDSTWFEVKRHRNYHSWKPDFFMELIEKVSDSPRLEMFARCKREGWHSWGNEVESDIVLSSKTGNNLI